MTGTIAISLIVNIALAPRSRDPAAHPTLLRLTMKSRKAHDVILVAVSRELPLPLHCDVRHTCPIPERADRAAGLNRRPNVCWLMS